MYVSNVGKLGDTAEIFVMQIFYETAFSKSHTLKYEYIFEILGFLVIHICISYLIIHIHYNEVVGGCIGFTPSVRPPVPPSVPHPVSAL